jgi:hypothetical protein
LLLAGAVRVVICRAAVVLVARTLVQLAFLLARPTALLLVLVVRVTQQMERVQTEISPRSLVLVHH